MEVESTPIPQQLTAEVISIGDELVSGQRLDTNSQWLSQRLGELGVKTAYHTTVGDNLQQNVEIFAQAARRVDLVVCTGGLGPTQDDLTRQAFADAFGKPLELHKPSLQRIEAMFARRNRPMPERNRIQAMFPEDSQVIENPHGSAPGIDLTVNTSSSCRLFALPGVPAEMRQMWNETVGPAIEAMRGADSEGPLRFYSLKVFGIGESDVEVKLPDIIRRDRNPAVGITVSRATITLRVAGRGKTEREFQRLIEPTLQEIRGALGDLVFGTQQDELQDVVSRQLDEQQLTMASLEIGAASWIGDWMLAGAVATGESEQRPLQSFVGSIAVPNLQAAKAWLDGGRPQPATEQDDWLALAKLVRERFHCDVALVTGIYPTVSEMEQVQKPFEPRFAISSPMLEHQWSTSMGGHPDVLGPRIAKTGLDFVRRVLAGLPVN